MDNKLISISKTASLLGVSIDTLRRWDKAGHLRSVRSGLRGHRFYNLSDIEQFTKDDYSLAKKWAEAPQGVMPEPDIYCQTRDTFQARLEIFQKKLERELPLDISSLITAISGEIGNNSFDHNLGNWSDIIGVYFSYSLKNKNIILADRGQGILTTLKRVKPDLTDANEALKMAFTENISGRSSETRGNGLKFVRQIIINNPFKLYFQTGDAYLSLTQDNKEVVIKQASSFIRGCFVKIDY